MGVMACVREGCNEILCKRHLKNYGYVCDDCFLEIADFVLDCDSSSDLVGICLRYKKGTVPDECQ